MASESTPTGDREQFHELLESFNTVALITHARPETGASMSDVEVTSRPMEVARLDDNCDLWFLTDADTAKVYEIKQDSHVHVVGQDDRSRFVSLSGTARVVADRAVIRELWSEPYEVWFPDGPDSPSIRAIHVEAHEGEYWDSKGMNRIKYLLQAAKAYATGTTPDVSREQSGRVEL